MFTSYCKIYLHEMSINYTVNFQFRALILLLNALNKKGNIVNGLLEGQDHF